MVLFTRFGLGLAIIKSWLMHILNIQPWWYGVLDAGFLLKSRLNTVCIGSMLTWKLSLRLLNLQNGAAIFWSRNFHTFKSHHLEEWILCKDKKDTKTERSFGKSWHHTVRRITDGWSLMVGLGININAEGGGKRKRLISTENITWNINLTQI